MHEGTPTLMSDEYLEQLMTENRAPLRNEDYDQENKNKNDTLYMVECLGESALVYKVHAAVGKK